MGQGDSTLIQFPKGKTLLIDAGNGGLNGYFGSRVILPELLSLGILTLDIAFLSHPDSDHGKGYLGLFKEKAAKEFWVSAYADKGGLLNEIKGVADENNISTKSFKGVFSQSQNEVFFKLIPLMRGVKKNDRSMVLLIDYKGCTLLFTGDIEKKGEEELLQYRLPKINILKVAHHGSVTSTGSFFLSQTTPDIAVISSGLKNQYGHPHSATLLQLRNRGSQIFRTDFHGFLRFRISKEGTLSCDSYLGPCGVSHCR